MAADEVLTKDSVILTRPDRVRAALRSANMKRLVWTFTVVVVVTFAVGDGSALAADLSVG